jgi:two-component system alkaline phosphatase synthesis response regulator PhoP
MARAKTPRASRYRLKLSDEGEISLAWVPGPTARINELNPDFASISQGFNMSAMSAKKIFIVEDEQDIAELIRFNLSLKGHQVETFPSGEDGLRAVKERRPDLLILDIMLPGLSGLEVCERIKAIDTLQDLPIIMVSAKGEENDIVRGLELGADDYVTKPFSTVVLNARVDAVLRRRKNAPLAVSDVVSWPGLEINPGRVEVLVDGKRVDLTQSEFKILHFLAQRPGWVYTRGQIVEAVRGENYAVTDRTIDFQLVGLRKKLGAKGDWIETVRGVGYRFRDQE